MMPSTPSGEKGIGSINIMVPSKLKSQHGIKIGSAVADVLYAYGKFRAPDSEGFGEPDRIFVGSSIYGAMIFTFSDGKVSEILLGAASE